jgi:hypothetical protein
MRSSADRAASFICPLKCCDSVSKRPTFTTFKIHLSQAPNHSTCALDKLSSNRRKRKNNLAEIFVTQPEVHVLLGQLSFSTSQYMVAKTLQKNNTELLRHKIHSRNVTVLEKEME